MAFFNEKGLLNGDAYDSWTQLTGIKKKEYSPDELKALQKPFALGWKREVVIRAGVNNQGKKLGDIYYHAPDHRTKLRSGVELGIYCKCRSSVLF